MCLGYDPLGKPYLRELRVGDRVYWNRRFGARVRYNGIQHIVMSDGDILIVEFGDEEKSGIAPGGSRQDALPSGGEIPPVSTN